jgi:hypothetical protein
VGIEAKHFYRFKFLQSEEWQTVRIKALARERGRCQVCLEFSLSNDAHHVRYPSNIFETKEDDLVILCRPCHDLFHEILDVHNLTTHTQSQFDSLKQALRVWKQAKRVWIASSNDEEDGYCKICRKASEELIYHSMFGGVKFTTLMCPECVSSSKETVEALGHSDYSKHKVYHPWKKGRENLHKKKVEVF